MKYACLLLFSALLYADRGDTEYQIGKIQKVENQCTSKPKKSCIYIEVDLGKQILKGKLTSHTYITLKKSLKTWKNLKKDQKVKVGFSFGNFYNGKKMISHPIFDSIEIR